MGYNLLINGVYRGYNLLTNHLLTSWDIQARDEDFSATHWQLLHVQLLGQVQGGPLGPKGYDSAKKGSHVPPVINDWRGPPIVGL